MANTAIPDGAQYHSWKPEPLARGTFSILSPSLLTEILCVWTAVHFTIPEHGKVKEQTWQKLGWMIIALLAPEYVRRIVLAHARSMLIEVKVVLTAYNEHVAARSIGKLMRAAFGQPEPPGFSENLERIPGENFRTVMGWLRLLGAKTRLVNEYKQGSLSGDVESGQASSRRQRMTLTLEGIDVITKYAPEVLPDLSKSEIRDKSKANAFTNIMACGQALWFSAQCVSTAEGQRR